VYCLKTETKHPTPKKKPNNNKNPKHPPQKKNKTKKNKTKKIKHRNEEGMGVTGTGGEGKKEKWVVFFSLLLLWLQSMQCQGRVVPHFHQLATSLG